MRGDLVAKNMMNSRRKREMRVEELTDLRERRLCRTSFPSCGLSYYPAFCWARRGPQHPTPGQMRVPLHSQDTARERRCQWAMRRPKLRRRNRQRLVRQGKGGKTRLGEQEGSQRDLRRRPFVKWVCWKGGRTKDIIYQKEN